MPKLDRVVLGIFLLATFLMATRNARADGFLDINGTFASINVSGSSSTSVSGINDAGDIVGSATVGSQSEGFFYNGTTYTPIVIPGWANTYATGINNLGEVVGYSANSSGPVDSFLYNINTGTFTSLSAPDAESTKAYGINNAGQIVGVETPILEDPVGFLYSGGTFNGAPAVPSGLSSAYGINDNGEIVGVEFNPTAPPAYVNQGFVGQNGSFTNLSFLPGGINNAGEIVGGLNGQGVVDQGGTLTDFSVPGSTSTTANGDNNNGEIVGDYVSSQSVPAPEPGTLALLATALVVFAGIRYRRRWPLNV